MLIGTQLVAPNGFRQLSQGVVYYFLKSDPQTERVLLVVFSGAKHTKPGAHLVVQDRDEFELGIKSGKIVVAEAQALLPPWLEGLEGVDLSQVDSFRLRARKSHATRVEERLILIAPALKLMDKILGSDEPEKEINRYARSCNPPQNESRFRLWLLSYLCFGRNQWILLPPFQRIGHWERCDRSGVKFGRHSIANGKGYGFGTTPEMIEDMIRGYLKFADIGVKMTTIYEKTMLKIFKCRVIETPSAINPKKKVKHYIRAEGKPFPSYWQFRYRIGLKFGLETIQKTLYGAVRHRARLAPSKGGFAEAVANLMERIEADGYYTKERPRGYVEGSVLPSLCVVRSRDLLAGMVTGIGFSHGKERSAAYRMMLFCMAVPKDFFGMLFGIPISKEEWPSEGLPLLLGLDRGPGAKRDLIENIEKRFPIRDIAPSWSGQSKATVESSHPRDTKIEGQPTFIQSDLTPVQLARREIYELLKYNHSADMSGRIQPNSEMALIHPTPIELWRFYDERFRSDAQPMSINDAIRTFLEKIELVVNNDGVWLGGQKFDSEELRASDILEKVARASSARIQGYCLELCVRYVWMELDGRLIMLEAQSRIRGDDEDLFVSLSELAQWDDARSKVNSEFREHQRAAASEYRQRFEESTGVDWNAGRRKGGKPPRNATTIQEELEARHLQGSSRKVA